VEVVLEEAARQHLEAVYLLTETAPDFFGKMGFRRIDRTSAPPAIQGSSEFAVLCRDSAVAMTREL
jgi:amino-acid N-acetyltransferase